MTEFSACCLLDAEVWRKRPSQIYRLVGYRPERISLTVLGALIDALDCTVEDRCAFRVEAAAAPKAVNASPVVVDLHKTIRPKRDRVRRTD